MKPVCAITVERLAEYLADELDERAAAEMRAHLDGCAACRAEEAELAPVLGMLARDAAANVPDPGEPYWKDFAGRVRTRRAREAVPAAPRRRWGARLAWAASIALVVGLAMRVPTVRTTGDDLADELVEAELSLEELDADELARVEERLLTPAKNGEPVEDDVPGGVVDELLELDALGDEELQELLKRIEAIRT